MRLLRLKAPEHFDDTTNGGQAAKLRYQAQRCRELSASVARPTIAKTFMELATVFEARAATLEGKQNEHVESHCPELHAKG